MSSQSHSYVQCYYKIYLSLAKALVLNKKLSSCVVSTDIARRGEAGEMEDEHNIRLLQQLRLLPFQQDTRQVSILCTAHIQHNDERVVSS